MFFIPYKNLSVKATSCSFTGGYKLQSQASCFPLLLSQANCLLDVVLYLTDKYESDIDLLIQLSAIKVNARISQNVKLFPLLFNRLSETGLMASLSLIDWASGSLTA